MVDNTTNSILFFKIWRNNWIKQNIFNHIKLYQICIKHEPVFNNLKSFIKFKQHFKYYDYFQRVKIKILDRCFDRCELIIFSINLEIFNEMVPVNIEHYYEDYHSDDHYEIDNQPLQNFNANYLYQILNYFNQSIIGLYFINSEHQIMGNEDEDENSILYNSMIQKFKSNLVSSGKIPSSVLEIHFDSVDRNDLSAGSLPSNLISLSFGNSFNQPIKEGVLSNCKRLLNLEFGTSFYNDIQELPDSLLNLSISSDHPIDFKLPNNITNLKFQIITSKIQPNWIRASCKSLYLGEYFNHSLGGPSNSWFPYFYNIFHHTTRHVATATDQYSYILPLDSKLEFLSLGQRFRQKINIGQLAMCKHLTTIILSSYNSTIEIGTFPNSCLHLKFEYEFNNGGQKLIKNCLPPNLKTLDLGLSFNQEIDYQVLPSSLEFLKLGMQFNKPIDKGVLPGGLKKLHLFFSSQIKSLKGINISNTDVQLTCSSFPLFQNKNKSVFKSITHIELLSYIGGSRITLKYPLPKHLKSLDLGRCELDHPFDFSKLPISITSISFPMYFNAPLNGSIKSKTNLNYITFRDNYNCCVLTDNEIPNSIKQLKIGSSIFNFQHSQDSLDNSFPHLSFYYSLCKIIPFQFSDPHVNNFQFNNNLNCKLTDLYKLNKF